MRVVDPAVARVTFTKNGDVMIDEVSAPEPELPMLVGERWPVAADRKARPFFDGLREFPACDGQQLGRLVHQHGELGMHAHVRKR